MSLATILLEGPDRQMVAYALRLLFKQMRRDGLVPPAHLVDLANTLTGDDTSGHDLPNVADVGSDLDHELMTVDEVALTLRVSTRTVARRIADGSMSSLKTGHRRLIRRAEIEGLVDGSKDQP